MQTEPRPVDIAIVGDDSTSNSLGRAYCLWLIAQELGLTSVVVTAKGKDIWEPLAHTEFATNVVPMEFQSSSTLEAHYTPRLILCVKPLPASFNLARSWSRRARVPMLLDVDDPDIEAGLSEGEPFKMLAKAILRPRATLSFLRARQIAKGMSTVVSNPYLQDRYGGRLVPHVRIDPGRGTESSSIQPTVGFIGTSRAHKGTGVLREAIERLQGDGFSLVITDQPPSDAKVWENWVGRTTLADGLKLSGECDIIAIPSLETPFSRGQLPAKLVDAMLLGRAIVASDLPPIRWALGDTGLLVRPNDPNDLARSLEVLRDPDTRNKYGDMARSRGLELFSVSANLKSFQGAYTSALGCPV